MEAYGPRDVFFTPFIVWNCSKTGRELIADTNYNLRLGTPVEDFNTEHAVAAAIQCHRVARSLKPHVMLTGCSARFAEWLAAELTR